MKTFTKTAVVATCASAAVLYITGGVTQSLVSDGKKAYSIISWHIPLYGSVELPEWTWWTFIKIWLASLVIPAVLWLSVGVRTLVSKSGLGSGSSTPEAWP
jgi:hypothetical protein